MKELVVLSGKGGTGKTSIVGCLAAMQQGIVVVDCDVDAANLHIILAPETDTRHDFVASKKAQIDGMRCLDCGDCLTNCAFGAIQELPVPEDKHFKRFSVNPLHCEGCGVCAFVCPVDAVRLYDHISGQWFESTCSSGPFVHGELGVGQSNSGKMVSQLRSRAREISAEKKLDLIIVDGPPGIGCPVVASLTGADYVLMVTEPSYTALHDMKRVLELASHFDISAGVCINKYDINTEITQEIEREARDLGADLLGRISFDPIVSDAQRAAKPLIEYTDKPIAFEIKALGERVAERVAQLGQGQPFRQIRAV